MAVDIDTVTTSQQPGTPLSGTSPNPNVAVDNTGDLYAYEADTNRLARGQTAGTVVETKDSTRRTDIQTALSIDSWDEPLSPYGGSYPHNNVRQTPNGLIEEFDDTPNNIRYHRYHPSGTYTEIDNNGTEVRKIVGDNFCIIEKNGNIFIGGTASVTIQNSCNILILGDANIEVNGKLNAVVKSDISLTASGSMDLTVGETLKIKAEDIVLESTKFNQTTVGTQKIKASGISQDISGNVDIKIASSYKIQSDTIQQKSVGVTTVNSSDFNLLASGKISQKATGITSIDGSDVRLGGSTLHINSAAIKAASTKKETQGDNFYPESTSGPSAVEAPVEAIVPTPQPPVSTGLMQPLPRMSVPQTATPNLRQTNNRIIRAGVENDGRSTRPSSDLYPGYNTPVPYTPTSTPTPPAVSEIPILQTVDNSRFINATSPPYNELISQFIRLKDVSINAAARGHQIVSQKGLTIGQIITNLQSLSVNVIDKIYEKYGPTMVITSGFRQGTNDSQHCLGQAVDIQFRNLTPSQYAERASELMRLVPFDQFLLEYQTTGSGNPWLHISFNSNGNRRQYFTMMNHSRTTPIGVLA